MSELRQESNKKKILEVLLKSVSQGTDFLAWQSVSGKKNKTQVKISEIDEAKGLIRIEYDMDQKIQIYPAQPIYLYDEGSSILFKENFAHAGKKSALINIPSEMRVIELRDRNRVRFNLKEKVTAIFFLGDKTQGNEFRLYDISSGGVGVFLTENEKELVQQGQSVRISSINGSELDKEILGEVRYLREIKIKNLVTYRFGVQFEDELPLSALESLV